ncbi:MAG: hypothetical protein D6E12_17245 [Desulfovibrio sp.]|nr:MAG: hypothetical protein D6E12_17245 [Desulfovibrio sp.]
MSVHHPVSRVWLGTAVGASGSVGAVVGGTVAAARDFKLVKEGEMTRGEAAVDVGKEAVGTGLATATGVAVVGALGVGGLLGLAGIMGVAAGTKYLWNKRFGYKPKLEEAKA